MKYNTILWLLLLSSQFSLAQTLVVKDKETKEIIEFFSISSQQINELAISDEKGKLDVSPFKVATDIEIRALGYSTQIFSYSELEKLNYEVYLSRTALKLDEIIVSATRWRQGSGNVPAKIISISTQEVALQNPQTAADLLNISGKVYVQKSQQGGGSPMIRGFASNRLLYSVDGIRMNTAIFRGGNIQNVINLDPFAIEHTEVLFGPGSVIYGSDAIGGVMNFETLTPEFTKNRKFNISGKSLIRYSTANNENTGHIDLNLGGKKWAYVGSFSNWDYDHLRQGKYGPDDYIKNYFVERQGNEDVIITQSDSLLQIPSAYSQWNTMHKLRFKPNQHIDISYAYHYSKTSQYGRYDRHNRIINGTPRYAEWDYGPQSWIMNQLQFKYSKSSLLFDDLNLRFAYQIFGESRIERAINNPERYISSERVDAYSGNLDLVKKIDVNHQLFYGAEYILNQVQSSGEVKNISTDELKKGPSRYPVSAWQSLGLYIHDELQIHKKWNLQAGLRYNFFLLNADFQNNIPYYPLPFDEAKNSDGAVTGSIGAVFRPSESLVYRFNSGTAFRAPNVDDIGKIFDSEPGAVTIPNPNLKAEYAYNIDLSVAKIFLDRLKIDASVYYTWLKNAMVRRNYTLNGQDSILYEGVLSQIQAIQNASKANVYGIQLGFEFKLLKGLNLSSDFNYQKGKEELEDGSISPSRHASPVFGIGRISYTTGAFKTMIYCQYQGIRNYENLAAEERSKDEIYAKDKNGNNFSPAWYTLNAKATYEFRKVLILSAGIENLTDRRYRPYSSGISGAGFNFLASVCYTF